MPANEDSPAESASYSENENGRSLLAEVIAVGDEMTSGQRLDTNSKWLSTRLAGLGIQVAFHSTVGDDLARQTDVLRIASGRADIVVLTGGLGPTRDDLTRQAVADAADVELEFHPAVVEHIRRMFARFDRTMPDSNQVQAYLPAGARVIDNPEGTAPGIDFVFPATNTCRLFALPGVPAEMKQMWDSHVIEAISAMFPNPVVIHNHVLHCFGIGESEAESRLPELMRRDRDPRVGITASSATISFRISAEGSSMAACLEKMQPTIREIRAAMKQLVFGENGDTLQAVVARQMNELETDVAFVDFQFGGQAARLLQQAVLAASGSNDDHHAGRIVAGHLALNADTVAAWSGDGTPENLTAAAKKISTDFNTVLGVAVGPLIPHHDDPTTGTFRVAISGPESNVEQEFNFAGHSSIRDIRSAKQVLNFMRLYLQTAQQNGRQSAS